MNKKKISALIIAFAVGSFAFLSKDYLHNTNVVYAISTNQNLSALTCIDLPKSGANANHDVVVSGWALNKSGVKQVQILVDGKFKGNARIGDSRPDVARAFPSYKQSNSGYYYVINFSNIGYGSHTVTVKSTGKDGTTNSNSVNININKLPSMVDIDTPKSSFIVNGNFKVAGWSLDTSGVKKVEVYCDTTYLGAASIRQSRPDVAKVFPAYKISNSGYYLTVSKNKIPLGKHTITVKSTGNDGTVKTNSVAITKPNDLLNIDSPANLQNVGSSVNVSGWGLSVNGTKQIQVLLDGKYKGNASIGINRPDVKKAYPLYNMSNSGFNYSLNTSKLSSGKHTLTVKYTDNIGNTISLNRTINIPSKTPITPVKPTTSMSGSELASRLPSLGFFKDQYGGWNWSENKRLQGECGIITIDGNNVYFALFYDNPTFNNNIKTIFNWLLPTKGNTLYNTVSGPFSNQTQHWDGRTVEMHNYTYPDAVGVEIR
ncbi:MAG: Ig-like domain-containing protein [Clostridium sp.]|uniref:Ig-like domain-containing protein n=1 Tax=Clostridium sp. TaxID=1506 RepID=UPI0039E7C8D5